MLPIILLLTGIGPANAHLPHDNAAAIAAPADMNAASPWYMVSAASRSPMLYQSDDGGRSWFFVGGPPCDDDIVGGVGLSSGVPVLVAQDGYWFRSGGTGDWVKQSLVGGLLRGVTGTNLMAIFSTDGIWRGAPGSALTQQLPGKNITWVQETQWGSMAIENGFSAFSDEGGGYLELGGTGTSLLSGVIGPGGKYVGDSLGNVWRWDAEAEGWLQCGPLPQPKDGYWEPFMDVIQMHANTTTLMAVTGWNGPFTSTNDCANWSELNISPLTTEFDGSGAATSVNEAAADLEVFNDHWVIAGWDGYAWSEDGGHTWDAPELIPTDYLRGMEFAPDFVHSGRAFLASEASGVILTEDGGATWRAPNVGMGPANVEGIHVSPWSSLEPSEMEVYAVSGHVLWVSQDGAESWERVDNGLSTTGRTTFLAGPDRVWVLGGVLEGTGGDAPVTYTDDYGETWGTFSVIADELDRMQRPVGIVQIDDGGDVPVICMAFGGVATVACSDDNGDTWDMRYRDTQESDQITPPMLWPPGAPTRVFFATETSLIASEDGGDTWTLLSDEVYGGIEQITIADDGTLFGATGSGRLLRSADGGESWEDLSIFAPAIVHELLVRPGFPEEGQEVLVATHDGSYVLVDALSEAPALVRFAGYQHADDNTAWFNCTSIECGEVVKMADAPMGTVTALTDGVVYESRVLGHTIRVQGLSDGGAASLEIDGGDAIPFGGDVAEELGTLVEVTGLEDTWHIVRVLGEPDSGVLVDAVIALGSQRTLAFAAAVGDSGDTADNSGDTEPPGGDTEPPGGDTDPSGDDTESSGGDSSAGGKGGCCSDEGNANGLIFLPLLLTGLRRRRENL